MSITVNAVSPTLNDAPVNTVPGPQNVPQDTALTFSTANGNRISIHDVDAGSNAVAVTLTATNGMLTLSGTTGLTFSSGDGTADASMAFTGTLVNINAALDGLKFSPTAGYSGSASVQIETNDQGHSGSGGAASDSDTVSITVNAVSPTLNDAPVNTVPGPQNVHQDTAFTAANSNLIAISDLDAGNQAVAVALTATNGTLTLSGTSGLNFTAGDGTANASMAFTGTLVNINAALDGLKFSPTAGYSGSATVQIVTDDQGNTGSGGAASDSDTVSITVNAVSPTLNDAPVNTVPGPQNVHQDTAFTAANSNLIAISDLDAGNQAVAVALTATNGTLTLSGTSGLNFTAGDGTANASMAFTGTLVNINAALDGLKFSPTAGYSGSATVQIVTDDQGNTGSGGAASDSDTVSITVNAAAVVNHAPTFTSTPVTDATQGTLYTYNITTTDVDGDTVTITHEGDLPSWLTLPTEAGDSKAISGAPGASDVVDSPYTLTLRVTDTAGDFTEQNFTITVNKIIEPVIEPLTLTVNPASFSEVAGTAASTATVTRPSTSGVLLVNLGSSDTSEVTVPLTVEIPDTQKSVDFNLAAADDNLTDGTQTVTLTASATGYTTGTATVSVTDNDVVVPPVPTPKTLTVTLIGNGSVTSEPTGIDCGDDCSETYKSGTQVTLSATPESGWQFQAWEGDCDDSGSDTTSDATSNNTVTLTMNANQTCKANFVPTLTVEKAGDGTVTSEPEGIDSMPLS